MNYFGELPNKFTSGECPTYLYWRVTHNLNKYFCLETIFIHGISMCKSVGEDSRHGIGHVDIRVGVTPQNRGVSLTTRQPAEYFLDVG